MLKRKIITKILLRGIILSCGIAGIAFMNHQRSAAENIPTNNIIHITQQLEDIKVIPDKYNTGIKGELIQAPAELIISGIKIKPSGGMDRKLDLFYQSAQFPQELVIENYDFSSSNFSIQNGEKLTNKVHLIFRNCKFQSLVISSGKNATSQFENCTFTHFSGSNANFNNCYFGSGTNGDGINPGENCTFTNCMVADLIHPADEANENHVDGFQIFGSSSGEDNVNIHLDNCRFEVPCIPFSKPSGALNCPLTMTMRYSNADNISFENCYINGGVYYAMMIRANNQTITNLSIKNIHLGGNSKNLYDCDGEFTKQLEENVSQTDRLYVSSVRKSEDGIHLRVSNDTRTKRKLRVVTNHGLQAPIVIPACPYGREIIEDSMLYNDFPFDVDVKIPDAEWVVCYDMTEEAIQIRFVNWSEKDVYLNSTTFQPVNIESTKTESQQFQIETETVKEKGTYTFTEKESVKGTQTFTEKESAKASESLSVLGVKVPKVKKVKGFKAKWKGKKLKLSWKKIGKIGGYQIQVSKRKSFSKSSKFTVSKSATSFRKKLKRGRKYYIRIRAFTYYKVGLYTKNVAYGKWVKLKKIYYK